MHSDKKSSSASSASYCSRVDHWQDAWPPLLSGTEWQTPAPNAQVPLPGINTSRQAG